jgi:hypothetical protein
MFEDIKLVGKSPSAFKYIDETTKVLWIRSSMNRIYDVEDLCLEKVVVPVKVLLQALLLDKVITQTKTIL